MNTSTSENASIVRTLFDLFFPTVEYCIMSPGIESGIQSRVLYPSIPTEWSTHYNSSKFSLPNKVTQPIILLPFALQTKVPYH